MLLRRLFLILAAAAPAQAQDESPLAGLLDAAIARAETKLQADLDIWQDHSTWETAWRVRTEHYEVRRVGSYVQAKGTADTLERALARFETTLGVSLPANTERMKVFVLPSEAAYRQFGDDHGEEHSSFYGSFYANNHPEQPVAMVHDSNWGRQYLIHSACHQFLAKAFPGRTPPVCVDEGLAAYFSMCDSMNFGWARSQFESWRGDDDAFIPLRRLLSDPIARYADNPIRRMLELGILFWYLFEYRDDTRNRDAGESSPFREYLLLHLRGQDPSRHELHWLVSGGEDRDDLENELRTEELRLRR